MQILHYLAPDGRSAYREWLERLRDMRAKVAVLRRIERLRG